MKTLSGIAAAHGFAEGKVKLFKEATINVPRYPIDCPEEEVERLNAAIISAREDLIGIKTKVVEDGASAEAEIFEAHLLFIEDPSLLEKANSSICQHVNAEAAWMDAIDEYSRLLESLEDITLRARAADVRDVGGRVLSHLSSLGQIPFFELTEPSIIIAADLSPSQTASFKKEYVQAICTAYGGPTSHSAILSKALGIPAVVGLGKSLLQIEEGSVICVDGNRGDIVIHPSQDYLMGFRRELNSSSNIKLQELEGCHECACTLDGDDIEVVSNIGDTEDARIAIKFGAEGVGLFRTEFLYLNRETEPNEQEQYKAYKEVLEIMGDRPVVVRTLDVGGDKNIPYINLEHEDNPFLGYRAIRLCLDHPDFFKKQLKALVLAGSGHDLRIMFPMISSLDEVRRAKELLEEAKSELRVKGYMVCDNIQVGIMVEIPAVAVMADQFAKEVDFFSIGTNDLTQYTMAAERTNGKVAHLGDPCSPAVIRQIGRVIQEAHKNGIWVGLCGELAGDDAGIPLLLGLGLDEFSMSPKLIPHAKHIIRQWSKQEAQKLVEKVWNFSSAIEVRNFVGVYMLQREYQS